MDNLMVYKGYHAKIKYFAEDRIFSGHVIVIKDILSFEGETLPELEDMFHKNIDDYLAMCASYGKEPDKEQKVCQS